MSRIFFTFKSRLRKKKAKWEFLNVIMLFCYYVITKKTILFNHFFNNTTQLSMYMRLITKSLKTQPLHSPFADNIYHF